MLSDNKELLDYAKSLFFVTARIPVLSTREIDQVLGQKGAFAGISSLDNYVWSTFLNRNNDLNQLKQLWEDAFIAKAKDMFKPVSQGGLGKAKMKQLFEFGDYEFDDFIEFKDYLKEQEFLDNALKFVKAE